MADKKIEVRMRLVDQFTASFQKTVKAMEFGSKTALKSWKNVENVGKGVFDAGKKMTAAVTLPLAGLAAASYKTYDSVDKQLALVKATMGDTAYASADLSAALKDAAVNSIFSMDEGANALVNFARQGWDAAAAADMLAPSMALAAGTATDLDLVTSGLGNTLKAFGASSDQASHYADMFTKAQAQANTNVTELIDSMSVAGPIAKTVGWDFEDIATLIGVFGDNSISASEGANALKTGLLRLSGGNTTANKELDKLGISLFDAEGNMKSMVDVIDTLQVAFKDMTSQEQLESASKLFGTNQASKWLALINGPGLDGLTEMRDNITGASGDAQKAADALVTPIEKLKSTFDVFKFTVGETSAQYITPFIEKLTDLIDKFRKLSPEQQNSTIKMAALAMAIGPVLMMIGRLVIFVGNVGTAFSKFAKAGSIVKGALAAITAPGWLVVAIVAAIVAVVAICIARWDDLKACLESVKPSIDSIKEKFDHIRQKLEPIMPVLEKVGSVFVEIFTGTILVAVTAFVGFFTGALDGAMNAFVGIADIISGVVGVIDGIVHGNWEKVCNSFKDIFVGVIELMTAPIATLTGAISGIGSAIDGAIKKLQGLGKQKVEVPVVGVSGGGGGIPSPRAKGDVYWRGGLVQVHERGGEILDLPHGTRIYPHDVSMAMAKGSGGVTVAKLADSIVVREDADIDRIADRLVRKIRIAKSGMGGMTFSGNMA